MKSFSQKLATLALALSILAPTLAYAQAAAGTPAAPATTAPAGSGVTPKMQTAIDRADKELDRRVAALTDLNTRIQAMQQVTADFKTGLATNVQNQINALTALKAKIDADTDAATLKSDVQSITSSYRTFALIMPQARIATAADREVTLMTMMTSVGQKLQARLSMVPSGTNVSALLTALKDMSAKLQDTSTQAQNSVSVSAVLVPDQGDKTKMTSNTAALKTARADILAGQKDLVAARKDMQTIIMGLKALPSTTASSTPAQAPTTPAGQ